MSCFRLALSNFEASQNYKDVQDPAIVVNFPLVGQDNTYALIWSTTPWTFVISSRGLRRIMLT